MARRWTGLGSALAVVLVASGPAERPSWVSLFDGKTLNGWTAEHTDRFAVRDGVIFNDSGGGWLRSAAPYKDFELQLEYRALKSGADSGIFFRATSDSTPREPHWPTRGYQLQVIDADSNLKIFGHGTSPPTSDRKTDALKKVMRGAGEWQKIALKVVGKRAEVALNGTPITVSDAILLPQGCLGLQAENGPFEWREIKVRELRAP